MVDNRTEGERSLVSRPDQPLSGTAITEMTQREQWNKKNPAVEATIVKDLRTTDLVAREYRGTKARFYRMSGAIRLQPHLSELPPGHASVKHRHTLSRPLSDLSFQSLAGIKRELG